MADNVAITAGSGTSIAADDITSVFYQRVKLSLGADGSAVDAIAGNGAVSTAVQRVTIASDSTGVVGLNAGTAHIGQVKTPIQYVTVTMTTPTGALAAGDVYAATQVVATCTQANDVCAVLQSATIIDVDDQKAALTLVFFDANTALGTEDAAPDIDDTEILTIQGHVVVATSDYVDYGTSSVAFKGNLGIPVKPATGTDDIYMAIYGHSTSTPTYAGGAITVRLGFI
jgi:hypothetical protein